MPSVLFNATVAAFGRTLEGVANLLDKAEAFCEGREIAPPLLLEARLIADMLPFAYQVKSTVLHSIGAIEGVRRGSFSPDMTEPPSSFDGLRVMVSDARARLAEITPEEIDSLAASPMRFEMGSFRADYTGQSFLLNFSVPNFYFHTTTAYGLLRSHGVGIGKRDYLVRVGD